MTNIPLCEKCGKVKLIAKKRRAVGLCAKCEKLVEIEVIQEIPIPPEPYTRRQVGPAMPRKD